MIWEEMSHNKFDYQGDNFRINELYDYRDEEENILYSSYELDIITLYEE